MSINKSLLSHLVDDNLKMVQVVFDTEPQSKKYVFKTNLDLDVYDVVVVPGPSLYNNITRDVDGLQHEFGMGLAIVKNVFTEPDFDSNLDYKWIIQKVELDNYANLVRKDRELVKKVTNVENKMRKQTLKNALFGELGEEGTLLLEDFNYSNT